MELPAVPARPWGAQAASFLGSFLEFLVQDMGLGHIYGRWLGVDGGLGQGIEEAEGQRLLYSFSPLSLPFIICF